jgi:hypothetical protein
MLSPAAVLAAPVLGAVSLGAGLGAAMLAMRQQ